MPLSPAALRLRAPFSDSPHLVINPLSPPTPPHLHLCISSWQRHSHGLFSPYLISLAFASSPSTLLPVVRENLYQPSITTSPHDASRLDIDSHYFCDCQVELIEKEIAKAKEKAWKKDPAPSAFVLFYDQFSATVAARSVIFI